MNEILDIRTGLLTLLTGSTTLKTALGGTLPENRIVYGYPNQKLELPFITFIQVGNSESVGVREEISFKILGVGAKSKGVSAVQSFMAIVKGLMVGGTFALPGGSNYQLASLPYKSYTVESWDDALNAHIFGYEFKFELFKKVT